jgi:IcmF-related N-terminal domain
MNAFMRFLSYLGRAILPVRLRPTVLQTRLQASLDKAAMGLEKGAAKVGSAAERLEGGEAPKSGRAALIFRWFLHFLILGLLLFGLYWLNRWLQLERVLRSEWPILHAYWLPILFLLLYFMAWLGWWIWELTGPEKLTNEFPDIDHAWKEGLRVLAESGINMRNVPVFLVLGRPVEGEDNVLLAAQLGFKVREIPRWPEAPLRFSGNDEAVFITCPGASVLGRHITLLIEEMQEALRLANLSPETGDVHVEIATPAQAAGESAQAAVAATTSDAELQTSAQSATMSAAAGEGSSSLSTEGKTDYLKQQEHRVVGLLEAETLAEKPAAQSRRRVFLKNKPQVQEVMARLQHVCQLITRQRRPYCPINGVVVLLPLAATDSDEDAAQATTACELDLTVVSEMLKIQCPIYAIACDAEKAPGFREFLARMPANQRDRRMGQRFPLVPDVEASGVPAMVQEGVGWFAYTFLPALVYNLFHLDSGSNGHPQQSLLPDAVAGNMRLYQFLSEMRSRRQRLTRFLTRGLLLDTPDSFFFGGIYLAGTGPDAERDRGFVSGVFQRLLQDQNYVAWTPEALAQDADFRRWARYGYAIFLGLLAATGVLVYRLWFR